MVFVSTSTPPFLFRPVHPHEIELEGFRVEAYRIWETATHAPLTAPPPPPDPPDPPTARMHPCEGCGVLGWAGRPVPGCTRARQKNLHCSQVGLCRIWETATHAPLTGPPTPPTPPTTRMHPGEGCDVLGWAGRPVPGCTRGPSKESLSDLAKKRGRGCQSPALCIAPWWVLGTQTASPALERCP